MHQQPQGDTEGLELPGESLVSIRQRCEVMAVARTCTPSGEARTASLRPLGLGHPWKGPSVDPLCRCLEVCLPGDSKSCQDVTVEVITDMVSCKVCSHEGHSQFDLLLRVFRTPLLLEPKASSETLTVCLCSSRQAQLSPHLLTHSPVSPLWKHPQDTPRHVPC